MAYTKTTWVNDSDPYLNATNLNKIEQGIQDAHTTADAAAPGSYGQHVVTWNGSAWRYRGATTAVRPTTVAAYNDGGFVLWDTSQDDQVNTPPALAVAGDKWMYHPDVTPTSA